MKPRHYFKLSLAVLLLELIIVMLMGYNLPKDAQVPIHWNWKNEIDQYTYRNVAIIPFWLINVGLFLLLYYSGRWSPVYKQNRERYEAIIPQLSFGITLFFAMFHIYVLYLAGHPELQKSILINFVLIGLLFIYLGNILPKIPRNFVAGIKTPWTFYNDEIWRKTSRLGGWCFFLFGISLLVVGGFNLTFGWVNGILITLLVVIVLLPLIYSFVLYLKNKKEE